MRHSPSTHSFARLDAAVDRAAGASVDIEEAEREASVRFWLLCGASARLTASLRDGGRWVLVTRRRCSDPVRAAHLLERSLTAAQRFSLSLWSDGLDAVWTRDGIPSNDAFRAAGLEIGSAEPVGLVWVSE